MGIVQEGFILCVLYYYFFSMKYLHAQPAVAYLQLANLHFP